MKFLLVFILLFVPCMAQAQHAVVNTNNAKLRALPDQNARVDRKLKKGTHCKVIEYGEGQRIDGHGFNKWMRINVKVNSEEILGWIYGGLLDLQLKVDSKRETKIDTSAYVRQDHVNIRSCPNTQGCNVLFQLREGQYCKILSKTIATDNIDKLGEAPWYLIEVGNRRGYIYGALLTLASNKLSILSSNAKCHDRPNGQRFSLLKPKKSYTILAQSKNSELIRPHGRNYWYQIKTKQSTGWVYGAFTSKKKASVNCQCVDFVKNTLSITGPTKNAFEWDQVLYGYIPVRQNYKDTLLNYEEIYDLKKVQKGDIAIFDKLHKEVDQQYGHIGFVDRLFKQNGLDLTSIEGGNHKVVLNRYYTKSQCHNVSKKNYRINEHVKFFRPLPTTAATTH